MRDAVSPSSLHSVPAAYSSSRETLLTALPCGHVVSLPEEIVLHEFLQLTQGSSTSYGSTSAELPQHKSSSKSQPFSGSTGCCSMDFPMPLCSHVYFSMALYNPIISPLVISEDCSLSACHLATGQREMTALACLPSPARLQGWFPHGCLSFHLTCSKTKQSSQNKSSCKNQTS